MYEVEDKWHWQSTYVQVEEEDVEQMCFLMVPQECAQMCIAYQEVSHCCLICWTVLIHGLILQKLTALMF